jgi:hypothetical protein
VETSSSPAKVSTSQVAFLKRGATQSGKNLEFDKIALMMYSVTKRKEIKWKLALTRGALYLSLA